MSQASDNPSPQAPIGLAAALSGLRDQSGTSLQTLSDERPTLVCLLRHNGCTFCRETIARLAKEQASIESRGYRIAVVGMSPDSSSLASIGAYFGLTGASWFADPDRLLYRALSVGRGSFWQLLGPHVIVAGILGIFRGYGIGKPVGDTFQMPGTAVIHKGRVIRQHIHTHAGDQPDFAKVACSINAAR